MAAQPTKVALITGGAGGIGLAVAQALAARGGWQIHLLDVKEDDGRRAAASLPGGATFHRADLTRYDELSAAVAAAHAAGGGRLDFVFANAGVIERSNLFELGSGSETTIPPPPDFAGVEVNLKGAINTVHLARHFMLRSPERGSIVVTGSCSSFWPSYWSPVYTASKFGILGFTRAVAGGLMARDGIRLNTVCPGAVRTSIVPSWSGFDEELFTPLDLVAGLVLRLARVPGPAGEGGDGGPGDLVDARGARVPADRCYGLAVVANGQRFYVQEETAYCDEVMERTIEATKPENQDGGNWK